MQEKMQELKRKASRDVQELKREVVRAVSDAKLHQRESNKMQTKWENRAVTQTLYKADVAAEQVKSPSRIIIITHPSPTIPVL